MFKETIDFIKLKYNKENIFLHEPVFLGNEKKYLDDCINSTFVSSVGSYVDDFEKMISQITNTKKSTAVVNGTAGLQVALRLVGVKKNDEVITQALTFIATANSIVYNNAHPIFLDVDIDTMGLSPTAVSNFLDEFGELREDGCYNKDTGRRISACMPMHTFGFPVHLDELLEVCNRWKIPVVEDAAESLGSQYKSMSTGSFGKVGVFSFNGNKIITTGGGGVITTKDIRIGKRAKFLTTTAKKPNSIEFIHNELGYNFRMPNINAALGCAQLEQINTFLKNKRTLAKEYEYYFKKKGIIFRKETPNTKANYWLMCIELENKKDFNLLLKESNRNNVMTRPIWELMFNLPMYSYCQKDSQKNALFLKERIINLPSGVTL